MDQLLPNRFQVINLKGRMRLRGVALNPGIRADMQLLTAESDPKSSTLSKGIRLPNLFHAQGRYVELSRCLNVFRVYGDLHMVKSEETHESGIPLFRLSSENAS